MNSLEIENTSEFEEMEQPVEYNPTTKGIMYKFYADHQAPKCKETGNTIGAGERFVMYKNAFYCKESTVYQREFQGAILHEW